MWDETWEHPQAFGLWKKLGAMDAVALIDVLMKLHNIIQECFTGFGVHQLL